ncbi:MAG: LacI family DNA-binding transcriptional regulator [Actinobacteria bacterium]|nr:LacI family DNA-binding transcriptional regulator [Actinomycetota bacterium]
MPRGSATTSSSGHSSSGVDQGRKASSGSSRLPVRRTCAAFHVWLPRRAFPAQQTDLPYCGDVTENPRARLSDIAEQAGVSEATVSRVLNDRPGVSSNTRLAVLTALDVLGYERPIRLRGQSGLVGLVVPELENPIFPAFAQVMETQLAQSGYTPVLCTQTPGGVTEDEYVELLLDRGVAGIIFVSGMHADITAEHGRYRALVERGLPIVLVNGFAEGVDAPFISDDDAAAMDLAVTHLAAMGHRRIGLALGPRRFVPVVRKRAAFIDAMTRLTGMSAEDASGLVSHSLFAVEGGQAAAHHLLGRGVTAVVCGSDLMALGAIRTVRQRGLRVPEDVSVVGYDDSRLIAFTDPPLTTVRQAVTAMGTAAVQALLDEISGTPAPRDEFVFRPELVVRGSTGPAPATG